MYMCTCIEPNKSHLYSYHICHWGHSMYQALDERAAPSSIHYSCVVYCLRLLQAD